MGLILQWQCGGTQKSEMEILMRVQIQDDDNDDVDEDSVGGVASV